MNAIVNNVNLPIGELCSHASHKNRVRAEYAVKIDDKQLFYVCPKHVSWPMDGVRSIEMAARLAIVKATLR